MGNQAAWTQSIIKHSLGSPSACWICKSMLKHAKYWRILQTKSCRTTNDKTSFSWEVELNSPNLTMKKLGISSNSRSNWVRRSRFAAPSTGCSVWPAQRSSESTPKGSMKSSGIRIKQRPTTTSKRVGHSSRQRISQQQWRCSIDACRWDQATSIPSSTEVAAAACSENSRKPKAISRNL